MNSYEDIRKQLEAEKAKLEKQLKKLEAKRTKAIAKNQKLDAVLANSGYKSAKALIKALTAYYATAASAAVPGKRRKRTKVTATLRDEIKGTVNGGMSKNAASKKYGISYAVLSKIVDGKYDQLT